MTIAATSATKTYNSRTNSTAVPAVTGLVGSDTVVGLSQVYTNSNVGSSKTISISSYTVSDGNSGKDYTVTTVINTTGVINKAALTITATTNTKNFDGTVTAAALPTVSGLIGGDTISGLAEVYADASGNTGKTLSVSAYTISDGNSGNNYAVTKVNDLTGEIDGGGATSTTTTISATVGGSSVTTVTYGTLVTLTATIAPGSGSAVPTAGSVDFVDGSTDLGSISTETPSGSNAIFTLITTANQLQVILANGGVHTITATYTPGDVSFTGSAGTLAGGLAVTPASLTITALTNTKTYNSTTAALATPTVAGLVGSDTVTGLTEVYTNANAGSSKTLSVSGYTINDTNGGKDYTVTTVANTTGVINKASLTITAQTNTKTYDSTTTSVAVPTVTGLAGGDTVTGLSEAYTDAKAGTGKTLNVNAGYTVNDGNSGGNYTVATVGNATGAINKATLTITAQTDTKIYNSTTISSATPTVSGLVGNDTVTGLSEAYANANAGTGKTLNVNAGYTVNDNNSGGNYTVGTVANTTGEIDKAQLSINAIFAKFAVPGSNTKTYDSTTTSVAVPVVSGLIGGDSVTGLSESYTNPNAGTGKTLNVNAGYTVNDGNSGGNYAVTTIADTTGVINQAALTITAQTNTKGYDSTTTSAAKPTVAGLIGNDTVTGLNETYANPNAGTGKTLNVSAGYTVNDGNSGGNYTVATAANTTGVITKAALTITALTNTKTYNASTNALATPTVAGLQGADTATALAEVYASANAGTGKTLSVSAFTINDGNSGNNYAVTTVTSTTGVINKAALTITALTNTKTYNASTNALATPTVAGLQGSDTVTGLAEVYTSANAGSSKTLSVSAFTINDSNSGNNYALTTVTNTTGLINKAALTITAITNTKTYDASTSALATPTVAGLQGADTVTGLAEVYTDTKAGAGKTLSVSAFTINDNNSGNNYALTTVTDTTGLINKAALTITALDQHQDL